MTAPPLQQYLLRYTRTARVVLIYCHSYAPHSPACVVTSAFSFYVGLQGYNDGS